MPCLFLLWHSPFVLLSEEIQFFSKGFPFLCHVQVFSCEISLACRLKWLYCCFSSHFCFLVIFSVDANIACIVSGRCNQSSIGLFLCSLLVVVSMCQHYIECLQVLFFLLIITHTVYLRHLCDVRPYALCWIFLLRGLLVNVLPLSHFKNGSEYSKRRTALTFIPLMRLMSYSLVSSSFLILLRYCFKFFFLSSPLVWQCPLPILSIICKFPFLRAFWWFGFIVWLPRLSFPASH